MLWPSHCTHWFPEGYVALRLMFLRKLIPKFSWDVTPFKLCSEYPCSIWRSGIAGCWEPVFSFYVSVRRKRIHLSDCKASFPEHCNYTLYEGYNRFQRKGYVWGQRNEKSKAIAPDILVQLWYNLVQLWYYAPTMLPAGHRPATSWVLYTTSCNTQSSAPEDGQNNCPKHVVLTGIINKPLLLHLVGCLYYLYQWCTVKQISDNDIYLLIKYIKSVLWIEAKRLSYIENARCLKVKLYQLINSNYILFYHANFSEQTLHTFMWLARGVQWLWATVEVIGTSERDLY